MILGIDIRSIDEFKETNFCAKIVAALIFADWIAADWRGIAVFIEKLVFPLFPRNPVTNNPSAKICLP
jgi:hypothetical protein